MYITNSIPFTRYFITCYTFSLLNVLIRINVNIAKGALTSFGVMCKTIAHSIQSRLLYVPAKFQG